MSTLEELSAIAGGLENPALTAWKEEGKKVVGYFCSYIPEELFYAADILPCRVRAQDCKDTSEADVHMSHLNCTFMRSCLQYMLEEKFAFLDGIVVSNSCDHARRMYDLLKDKAPQTYQFMHFLSVPRKTGDEAVEHYCESIKGMQKNIENTFDVKITEDSLNHAIDVYNETRSLLLKVYDLRKSKNPTLKGEENLNVLLAGTMMPKEPYNQLLKKLLDELGSREPVSEYKARLMIAGSGGCDSPGYYKIIEDLGGLIVTDTICNGSRYFWNPVETNGDLTKNIAASYLKRPTCPAMVDSVAERSRYVLDMAEKFNVDGVLYQRMRYCDLWGGAVIDIRKNLKEADVPMIEIEREYMLSSSGQLKTRIQAFLERIRG